MLTLTIGGGGSLPVSMRVMLSVIRLRHVSGLRGPGVDVPPMVRFPRLMLISYSTQRHAHSGNITSSANQPRATSSTGC